MYIEHFIFSDAPERVGPFSHAVKAGHFLFVTGQMPTTVTGYGQTSKTKSTNSTVRISAETITNRPNASLIQTLTGQVAGLDISTNSGAPGSNSLIELRGRNYQWQKK